jgi:NADPH:quinone reductase-like Zn-dependent oxidoreductase
MKAAIVDASEAPFRVVDMPRPSPGRGEVLVRIAASGVNPLDTKIRAGAAAHARHPLPAILGLDLAGVVEQVGEGVTTFRPGDEVFGMTGGVGGVQGTLAEYAAVDAALLARKPARLSMREAAALPLIVITAWEGLVDRARVRAGQKVLIHGGSGGVGHVAIQIARALGAEVFATDRGGRLEDVRALGAAPIDFETETVESYVQACTGGQGFDVVYDTVGGPVLDASFAAIRRFGHVVSVLGWGSHALAPLSFKGGTYSGVFTLLPLLTGEGRAHHGEILSAAADMVSAGKLTPRLDPRTFTLEGAGEAHAALTDRTARGKVVVSIGG